MFLPRPIPDALAELIAARLRVLGQPLRVRLIDRLDRAGEASVQAIANEVGVTAYNASQQLGVLRQAGLVKRRQHGRRALYRVSDPTAVIVYEQAARGLAEQARGLEQRMHNEPGG